MKKLLLTLLGVLIALPTMARDFTYTYAGQTINYTVVDEDAKTCKTGWTNVSGDLTLPSNPKDGNIEYTLVEIGSYAFRNCTGLTSITIPNSVTSIGDWAFRWCSGLTSVSIPNSVTEIGGYAFGNCSSLTSINISEYVSTLGDGAFCACTSLKVINVAAGNRNYTSVDGIVYSKDMSTLIQYPAGKATGFTIPNSVNTIGASAFEVCNHLLSIIIPNSVTEIGKYAFAGSSNLTSVTIGNSVTSISGFAFERCSGLTEVIFNAENCTICGSYNYPAFPSNLKTITIGENVKTIPSYAFNGCTGLTSVTYLAEKPVASQNSIFNEETYQKAILIYLKSARLKIISTEPWCNFINRAPLSPSNVIRDFSYTYEGQTITYTVIDEDSKTVMTKEGSINNNYYKPGNNVSGDLILPSKVYDGDAQYTLTEIGENAFRGCYDLVSVNIPNSVTTIGTEAFEGCRGLTSVTIPNSVITIGDGAFDGNGLTEVTIGNSVTTIGDWAFCGCGALTSVTIPNSVTEIGRGAFVECNGLTSVTIPSSVNIIGMEAFDNCRRLTSVTYLAREPIVAQSNIFNEETYQKATLNYLKGANEKIASTEPWCRFINSNPIIPEARAFTYTYEGQTITYTVIDEEAKTCMTKPGKLETYNYYYDYDNISWDCEVTVSNLLTGDLVLPANPSDGNCEYALIAIGDYSFCGISSYSTVEWRDGNRAGTHNYYNNSSRNKNAQIHSVVVPNSVISIGSHAFFECTELESIILGNSINSIPTDNEILFGCNNIRKIAYPNTIVNPLPDSKAFAIEYPAEDAIIEDGWVYGPNKYAIYFAPLSLEGDYVMPNITLSVGDKAFAACDSLTSLKTSSRLRTIGNQAFAACNLQEIAISPTVKSIGESAFANNPELKEVKIGYGITEIGDKAFDGCNAIENIYITASNPPVATDKTFPNYRSALWLNNKKAQNSYFEASDCWYWFGENMKSLVAADSVVIENQNIKGKAGETLQLEATMFPKNATLKDIFWKSTNTDVAIVDGNGLVTFVAPSDEECEIIALTMYENAEIAEISVTTLPASSGNDPEEGGIEEVKGDSISGSTFIYNLRGVKVGESTEGLPHGVYIIRQGSKTTKHAI